MNSLLSGSLLSVIVTVLIVLTSTPVLAQAGFFTDANPNNPHGYQAAPVVDEGSMSTHFADSKLVPAMKGRGMLLLTLETLRKDLMKDSVILMAIQQTMSPAEIEKVNKEVSDAISQDEQKNIDGSWTKFEGGLDLTIEALGGKRDLSDSEIQEITDAYCQVLHVRGGKNSCECGDLRTNQNE